MSEGTQTRDTRTRIVATATLAEALHAIFGSGTRSLPDWFDGELGRDENRRA